MDGQAIKGSQPRGPSLLTRNTDLNFQHGLKKLEEIGQCLLNCSFHSKEHLRLEEELVALLRKQSPGKNLHDMAGAAIELGLRFFMLGASDSDKKDIAVSLFYAIESILPTDFIERSEAKIYATLISIPTRILSINDAPVHTAAESRNGRPLADLFWAEKIIEGTAIKQDLPRAKRFLDKVKEGIGEDLQPYFQQVQEKYNSLAPQDDSIWSGPKLEEQYKLSAEFKKKADHEIASNKKQARGGNHKAACELAVDAALRRGMLERMEIYAGQVIESGTKDNTWLHVLRFTAMLTHLETKETEESYYKKLFLGKPITQLSSDVYSALRRRLIDAYKQENRIAALLLVRLCLACPEFDKSAKTAKKYIAEVNRYLIECGAEERQKLLERVESMSNKQAKNNDDNVKKKKSFSDRFSSAFSGKTTSEPTEKKRNSDVRMSGANNGPLKRASSDRYTSSRRESSDRYASRRENLRSESVKPRLPAIAIEKVKRPADQPVLKQVNENAGSGDASETVTDEAQFR